MDGYRQSDTDKQTKHVKQKGRQQLMHTLHCCTHSHCHLLGMGYQPTAQQAHAGLQQWMQI
eukprot:scaffold18278_cov22-Tisochrysis_lutea.AAC.1